MKNSIQKPMNMGKSLLVIMLLSFAGVFLQSIVQNGFLSGMHFVYIIYPAIVILNALPVFLIITLFYFLTGKIWIGTTIAYLPLYLLNVTNFFKTKFRDEPLKLSDIQLIGETRNITQNYELKVTFGMIVGAIFAIAIIIYTAKRLKSEKLKWHVKSVGAVSIICVMLLSFNFIYTNKWIYENIPTFANEYHDSDMAKHHGMLYTLLVSSNSASYDMPEGYSDEVAESLLSESADATAYSEDSKKINVIAIMGEAFFDVTRGGKAQFAEGVNPYENYETVKKEGYFGKLVVPGFGGSTESTEFEFLTGASQYLLDNNMPTAYKTFITQPAYSLPRFFKDNGYRAVALHPGYEWFYNRKGAYQNLGFDDFISREDMGEDAPKIFGYIEDGFTADRIIGEYLKHYEEYPEMPYFNFNITIQNHGPYPDYDYGRDIVYERPENMSDENFYIINNYLNGIRDTDNLLGDIKNFAAGREEPIAILFFGDHMPYLDANIECFDALGYNISHKSEEGLRNKYMMEYVMWCNQSANDVIKEKNIPLKRGEGPEISANFLGTEFLNYLGMKKSAYFDFVDKVQDTVSIISPNYYKINGEFASVLDEESKEILKNYEYLQYFNLRKYNKIDK